MSTMLISSRRAWNRVSSQEEEGQYERKERGRDEEKGMGEAYQGTSFTENEQFYIRPLGFCPSTSLSLEGVCPKHHQKTLTTCLVTNRTLISDVSGSLQFGNLPRYRNQRGGGASAFLSFSFPLVNTLSHSCK